MTLTIKKILCPTDFSRPSFEGLKAGNELAVYFSAELIAVHVVSTAQIVSVTAAELMPRILAEIEASARAALDKVAQERIAKGVKARTMMLQGNPADQIVDIARKEAVDLIVIATHGQSGWKKLISGSVAESVVRSAGRPVLTISAPARERE